MKRGLLFSFEGMIGRGQFWIGVIILELSAELLDLLLGYLFFGVSIWDYMLDDKNEIFKNAGYLLCIGVLEIVFLYLWVALMIKRLRDRERNTAWLWLYAFPGFLLGLLYPVFLYFNDKTQIVEDAISIVFLIGVLGMIIDLAILAGRSKEPLKKAT